jgi:hypothetical protein
LEISVDGNGMVLLRGTIDNGFGEVLGGRFGDVWYCIFD